MATASREDITRRVREATDIVQLIGEHLSLRPHGREFVGLCPFHDDSRPSMNVVPDKQFFKCFACGAGGDVFTFMMNYHKMTFPEALRALAERANIEIPKFRRDDQAGDPDQPSPRQRILTANQQALKFFRHVLLESPNGAAAREYLQKRGINAAMSELFQIGAAPDEWDALAQVMAKKKWDREAFEMAGLISARKSGPGYMDRLRHRLIFPILDNLGRPIAFGGRIMPDSKRDDASDAKYLNSPEHAAFNKSATLFGIHAAHKPIIDSRTAIIVEGYTDVIACHQAGVRNVVATLGTAMTAEHAKLLLRYCDRVVLIFDADEAGQKAADRAIEVLFSYPLDIGIAVLPDELDPADLLARAGGTEAFEQAAKQATDALHFQFSRIRRKLQQTDSMAGHQRIVEEFLQRLVQLGIDRLDRKRYGLLFAQVGQLLGVSADVVAGEVRKLTAKKRAAPPRPAPSAKPPALENTRAATGPSDADLAASMDAEPIVEVPPHAGPVHRDEVERQLVGGLLLAPELFELDLADGRPVHESVALADFTDAEAHAVFHRFSEWMLDHGQLPADAFREAFPQEVVLQQAFTLQAEVSQLTEGRIDRLRAVVGRCAEKLVMRRQEEEYRRKKLEIAENGANDSGGGREGLERLKMAITHYRSNPNVGRTPRGLSGEK